MFLNAEIKRRHLCAGGSPALQLRGAALAHPQLGQQKSFRRYKTLLIPPSALSGFPSQKHPSPAGGLPGWEAPALVVPVARGVVPGRVCGRLAAFWFVKYPLLQILFFVGAASSEQALLPSSC